MIRFEEEHLKDSLSIQITPQIPARLLAGCFIFGSRSHVRRHREELKCLGAITFYNSAFYIDNLAGENKKIVV